MNDIVKKILGDYLQKYEAEYRMAAERVEKLEADLIAARESLACWKETYDAVRRALEAG
jgi:hypothetical protein